SAKRPTADGRPWWPHRTRPGRGPTSRWPAGRRPRWPVARATAAPCFRRSSSKKADPWRGGLPRMSIKSDNWIRRMAREHRMIEPFAPYQVRVVEDVHLIVSYGTSCYGYDMRCANEFKILTNINPTIVYAKRLDAKRFVDENDDVCIIPPHSFALARTVEYLR